MQLRVYRRDGQHLRSVDQRQGATVLDIQQISSPQGQKVKDLDIVVSEQVLRDFAVPPAGGFDHLAPTWTAPSSLPDPIMVFMTLK